MSLIATFPGYDPSKILLGENGVIIGRSPSSPPGVDLQPIKLVFSEGRKPCLFLSRDHCSIEKKNNQWTIKDLGSNNGVFINGTRLKKNESVGLVNKCLIKFACIRTPPFEFLFEQKEEESSSSHKKRILAIEDKINFVKKQVLSQESINIIKTVKKSTSQDLVAIKHPSVLIKNSISHEEELKKKEFEENLNLKEQVLELKNQLLLKQEENLNLKKEVLIIQDLNKKNEILFKEEKSLKNQLLLKQQDNSNLKNMLKELNLKNEIQLKQEKTFKNEILLIKEENSNLKKQLLLQQQENSTLKTQIKSQESSILIKEENSNLKEQILLQQQENLTLKTQVKSQEISKNEILLIKKENSNLKKQLLIDNEKQGLMLKQEILELKSSQEKFENQLEILLKCPACDLKISNSAACLPCGHVFCSSCLKSNKCPTCFKIPLTVNGGGFANQCNIVDLLSLL